MLKEIFAKILRAVIRQVILCLFKLYHKCLTDKERNCGKEITDHGKDQI
jgi:hypothetical protein